MSGGGLYDVLGVPVDASTSEIRRAFRAVARTCHPDLAGHDERKARRFRDARDAYEVLTDPARRTAHDRALGDVEEGQGGRSAFFQAFWNRSGSGRAGPGAADPTPDARRPAKATRGDDVDVDVDVPARVARQGGPVGVRYMRLRRAASWQAGDPGNGTEPVLERREIEVPAGTRMLQSRRYPGLGDAGEAGGPHGDLVAHFRIVDDEEEVPAVVRAVAVSVPEAMLGASIPLDTPQGRVRLVVPPGSSSGARLRLRGKGSGPGRPARDLLVELRIVVPDTLDAESRRLVEALAARLPTPTREG